MHIQRVFVSGEIDLGDVLYVKKDGHIYAEGWFRAENLEIPLSLKSRHYVEIEESGATSFICEGILFPKQTEDEFSLQLAVHEIYPYSGKGINRVILHGSTVSIRRTRSAYIFEVLSEAHGIPLYLSVFCDMNKLREVISEKDEVIVVGRLRNTSDTGEYVIFADEVCPTLKNYEFIISRIPEEVTSSSRERVWTDEE